jgi:hypothetical protein
VEGKRQVRAEKGADTMKLTLLRRSAAVACGLCTAIGLATAPLAASASIATMAAPRVAALSACTARDLVVTADPSEHGLTHVGIPIELRNVGATACNIRGYPAVVAINDAGHVVARATQQPSNYFGGLPNGGTVPTLVVVEPGKQASALVTGFDFNATDPATSSCPAYAALLVTPPGTSATTRIAASRSGLCSGLEISPVVPGTTGALTAGAENLVLTAAVRSALVAAAAAYWKLPPSAFSGLRPGSAYYAYDISTQTYWAGASLIPSPSSQEAGVVVQDDGGYVVFHRPAAGAWQAQEDGLAGSEGVTCATYHVSIPADVLAVWDWPTGTCTPPANAAPTPAPPSDFALAKAEWVQGARAISAAQGGYWVAAAKDLMKAVAAKLPGTSGYTKAAKELVQLAGLPDAMQSPAQQKESFADVAALDAFFGTKGLYEV